MFGLQEIIALNNGSIRIAPVATLELSTNVRRRVVFGEATNRGATFRRCGLDLLWVILLVAKPGRASALRVLGVPAGLVLAALLW